MLLFAYHTEYIVYIYNIRHGYFAGISMEQKIFSERYPMRQVKNPQLKLGELAIADIKIDLKSRDDIPPLLLGLQYIYTNLELRSQVFSILEEVFSPGVNRNNGRPGMEQWKILVLGGVRLNLNCDYDHIHELANNHKTIRQMLGHATFADEYQYKLLTLKDNVSLLSPDILDRINFDLQIIFLFFIRK